MNILFTRTFHETEKKKWGKLREYYNIFFAQNEDEIKKHAPNADIIVTYSLSEEILNITKQLKIIQVPGAGVNKLPLQLLKKKGVTVCNSHSNADAVAEYAIALLLSSIKEIPKHDKMVRNGEKNKTKSRMIYRKNIGILGYGHIGKKIAHLLKGFNCTILPYSKNGADLHTIIAQSDYIIITLPLTDKTKHMITMKEFNIMKKNTLIVNVGRAEIIKKEDLYTALHKEMISAAIDVWYDDYNEKQISTLPFEKLDNLIISPYRAYFVNGSPHINDAIENLIFFATGKPLINKVKLEEGY